jgi:hypothetical protein
LNWQPVKPITDGLFLRPLTLKIMKNYYTNFYRTTTFFPGPVEAFNPTVSGWKQFKEKTDAQKKQQARSR